MSDQEMDQESSAAGSGVSRRNVLKTGGLLALGAAGASALAACSPSGGGGSSSSAATSSAPTSSAATSSATTSPTDTNSSNNYDYSALAGKTVGAVGVAVTSEAVARMADEAQRLAEENGFTVDVVDTNGDYQKASDALKLFADKGYAAAMSLVVDPNLMKDGADYLASKGIPLGGCFAGASIGDNSFDVTSNEWISGTRIGTYVAQRISAEGRDGAGIALLNWSPVPALQVREAAWKAMLDYYKVPILDRFELKVPGQVEDTTRIVNDLLTKYPAGGQLAAVLGGWGEIGSAASQAITKGGRAGDVFVVSIDGNLAEFDEIRAGAPLAATCSNDMTTISAVCLAQLATVVGGGTPLGKVIYVDAPFITKANVPPPGEFPPGAGMQVYYSAT